MLGHTDKNSSSPEQENLRINVAPPWRQENLDRDNPNMKPVVEGSALSHNSDISPTHSAPSLDILPFPESPDSIGTDQDDIMASRANWNTSPSSTGKSVRKQLFANTSVANTADPRHVLTSTGSYDAISSCTGNSDQASVSSLGDISKSTHGVTSAVSQHVVQRQKKPCKQPDFFCGLLFTQKHGGNMQKSHVPGGTQKYRNHGAFEKL